MFGTLVNAAAIIAGSLLGLLFSRGIPEEYKEIILNAVGLSVLLIGMKSALLSDKLMVVIFSIIIGAILGEALRIEMQTRPLWDPFLSARVAAKSSDTSSFARGFVTASLVFCVGSMAIVGALERAVLPAITRPCLPNRYSMG